MICHSGLRHLLAQEDQWMQFYFYLPSSYTYLSIILDPLDPLTPSGRSTENRNIGASR